MGVPRGVLFDAGGTLVKVRTDLIADGLRAEGHDPGDLSGAFWRALVLLDAEFGPAAGEWSAWFPGWLARMAGEASVPADLLTTVWTRAEQSGGLWDEPLPGAAACLRRLRHAGVPVGVVSNADGTIDAALARAGLAPYLDVIVDSSVVGVAKPDPEIFEHALAALRLPADATWYLGDTVAYDAAAADAAGLVSWVIDHPGLHTVAHPRRVRSLSAFADAVLAARGGSGAEALLDPPVDRRGREHPL